MFDMVLTFLKIAWAVFKIPLFIFLFFLSIFLLCIVIQFVYLYAIGHRFKKGEHYRATKIGFFKRLFILAPRRIMLDKFSLDPEFFRFQGLHIFCGEQGSGKTIALVEMMMRIQEEYPLSKCITNLGYANEDDELVEWQQLLEYNNGKKGVIVGIDELQNWFSSGRNQLPEEMLEVVTQNRKNRRIILGTSQVFTRMAKGIREQATIIYEPITFFGCITWVRMMKPVLDHEGNCKDRKSRGSYFFVHTPELRDAYDTYKVIHHLAKDGFKEKVGDINVSTVIEVGKKGKLGRK